MRGYDVTYETCLEAGGCTLHSSQWFGYYGGEWWAKVTYEGEVGFCYGYYGSCSGCDHLEGWRDQQPDNTTEEEWDIKAAGFAQSYLPPLSIQEAIDDVQKRLHIGDTEAEEVWQWILTQLTEERPELVMESKL